VKKTDVLKQPIRSKKEGAILAALFRNIVRDLGLTERFDDVIRKAAIRQKNMKSKKRQTEHSLTSKAVLDSITFKVFISLLRDVLNVVSMKITIELKHYNGKTTLHTLKEVKLKEIEEEEGKE